MKRFLKLYKVVNGERRLVDYGVASQVMSYYQQGYKMEWSRYHSPVYHVLKEEFDALWAMLPAKEQARLRDLTTDFEMGIEERLYLLKSEMVKIHNFAETVEEIELEQEEVVVAKPKRPSLFSTIKAKVREFTESLVIEPMFAFGHF